ncbi:MAG: GGDEF and EAL domain-containing protein [Selenomonadaceae bacterium]|nr:GGDEF and EAL domain-containing protein [Selenomonadaceae bacterium]MBQ7723939.1 GGDEF and EAL domain-containing protein [Selenomonadaceae bacterium]
MNTNFLQLGDDSPLSRIKTYFEALQHSADAYLFAVDLSNGQFMLSENFRRDFSFTETVVDDFAALLTPFIWHDDREIFEEAMSKLESVNPGVEISGEFRLLNRNGEYGWVSLRMTAGADEFGQPELVAGVISRMDLKLKADYVTGLLNRNAFHVDLMKELNSSPDARGAVIFVGLDNFQLITETYGYEFGDNALKQLAQDITNILPPDIRLYKLDNDMFAFYVSDVYPEEIEIIFSSIQLCMREIRNIEDTIFCTASGGAAFYPDDADDVINLTRYAEVALEFARQKGKDQVAFFDTAYYERWRYDIGMQNLMQNSIARGCEDFFLCYQPQVDAKTGKLVGAEALLRWYDKDGSVVAPMQFIPLLERSRMIIPVGHWIIENAVKTAKRWHQFMPDFEISVNISLYQLEEHMFYDFVKDCIERYQIDPKTLVFELTESNKVYDWDFVNKQFNAFHELGIKIAMDDFGMGYANLAFMKNFRCNQVKIDRVFVEDIINSEYDREIVKHVIMMCHAVGMEVVIEGVEDEPTLVYLRDVCNADIIQGFYFGYPETEDVFEKRFEQ